MEKYSYKVWCDAGLDKFNSGKNMFIFSNSLSSWVTQISCIISWRMQVPATLGTFCLVTSQLVRSISSAQWRWTPHLDCQHTLLDLQVLLFRKRHSHSHIWELWAVLLVHTVVVKSLPTLVKENIVSGKVRGLNQAKIEDSEWPFPSPDLFPIKSMSNEMRKQVHAQKRTDLFELHQFCQEEWVKIQ